MAELGVGEAREMTIFSERMTDLLPEVAVEFEPGDARWEVEHGSGWFAEEFEELIRARAFTPQRAARFGLVGPGRERWRAMEYALREIWQDIHPDRPFPYDEDPGLAPPELRDNTDPGGVSRRLGTLLGELYAHGDDRHLPMIATGVRRGGRSWLPATLKHHIQDGVFTPAVWSRLVYDGQPVDAATVDRDLHRLWAAIAPDQDYPATS